jgi:formylglycine-generating enzyme required for sulfatase activity
VLLVPTPATEHAEVQRRIDHALNENEDTSSLPARPTPKRPTSLDILPIPFAWITIPAGTVALGTCNTGGYLSKAKTFDVPAFGVTKYPLTNAQFAKFVEAGGYNQSRWWTVDGWQEKEHNKWVEPRLWQDKKWNQANHPVVGVSWYEAQAFCIWLGEITGEQIMLPTEQQWQRAAQGGTGDAYPWGNKFDNARCNFSSEGTTPVTQYEGKGNNSFGLVDMSGNVLEWCLTDYESGAQDMNMSTKYRVLRGGSWSDGIASYLRADFRLRGTVAHAYNNRGFRPVCSR